MIPKSVQKWCTEQGYGDILSSQSVGGGCINKGEVLKTSLGETFFLKTNHHTPPDMFSREAEGLTVLAVEDGPRVPKVYLFGEHFLLLENLSPASRRLDYWEVFGRQMAALHNHISDNFGFAHDNYIGSTLQPNPWTPDGYFFYMENRLNFQARLALESNLLDNDDVIKVENLGYQLPDLVPEQPASLIHGDLWSGNAMTDSNGMPAIIDPAAYYGWAEAELAMTALFGSFPEGFYRAYQEFHPIEPGFLKRFPIYNLYHLLNHLNLFGTGYRGQVLGILNRYVK